ncbi:MAG: substrate-binding domain-containing protein [Lachnospiraceae bacterium]
MRRKKWMTGIKRFCVITTALCVLTACQTKNTQKEQVKIAGLENMGAITSIAREEGSGTRNFFVDKIGLLQKDNSGKEVDQTRGDAKIAMDADAVINAVREDENAIGYVSLGGIQNKVDGIKTVKIDGVEANLENIENNKYILSRNFYLAYGGKLSNIEQDFMTYILSEGQTIVDKNYTKIKDANTFLSGKDKGVIKISGSTSVAPLIKDLANAYMKINKNAAITVEETDSTSGLVAAMQNTSDIGMSSRELKDYEKELLDTTVIAKDGVAVIVNEKNPVENLTKEQLEMIYSGKVKEWSDLNKDELYNSEK